MIKIFKNLTKKAKLVCLADFFWNFGRTIPHAFLTVFLLTRGHSLVQIAVFQSVYMFTVMFTEFPSGVWADRHSRKNLYIISIFLLFISYSLICLFSSNFYVMVISYILYGLSVSIKSGTLDADVVLEYHNLNLDVKDYSVVSSLVMSISSLCGGLIGSFLYTGFNNLVYLFSLMFFIISFLIAFLISKETVSHDNLKYIKDYVESGEKSSASLFLELKKGFQILKKSKSLLIILCLFATSTFFIQPFYQYWQVLYSQRMDAKFFGFLYIAFQGCNILGTAIYKHMKFNISFFLILIFILGIIASIFTESLYFSLPVAVVLFYTFYQHMDVLQKREVPKKYISTFFSLTGTVENIFSIISLFLMASLIEITSVTFLFGILFSVFAGMSIILIYIHNKIPTKQ